VHHVHAGRLLEIERDAALAAVDRQERAALAAALAEPRRMSSPVGGSTLMTSAPMSARFIEQNGAAMPA
jgi:hypothetical protein